MASDAATTSTDSLLPPAVHEPVFEVPRLRGVLHAVWAPLILLAGVLLALEAPTVRAGIAGLLFAAGIALTFGMSAVYHRGRWSSRMRRRMRQLDHAMIFVGMAIVYTAFWVGALGGGVTDAVLIIAWCGAIIGTIAKLAGVDTTRTGLFISFTCFGLIALLAVPQLTSTMGTELVVAQLVGASVIAIGGLVFVLGWPNPFPRTLGFHELFHGATVVGTTIQFAAFGAFLLGG